MSEKQNNNEQINNFTIGEAIDNIKDKKRDEIYNSLWKDNKFFENNIRVQKVFDTKHSVYSRNSYAFQIEDSKGNIINNKNISKNDIFEYICEKLIKLFAIINKERFEKKLSEACSGSGSEQRRITTLHSSSLCALLFFYNVSEENPLTLIMDSKKITFTDVLFEFQNIVIEGRKPSNVDIVLLGKDADNGENVILFLESKFSEYLDIANQFDLGLDYLKKYSSIYNDNNLKNINLCICQDKNGNPKFFSKKNREKTEKYNRIKVINDAMYIEGIKQMISHYIGITNLLKGNFYNESENKLKEKLKNAEIYLGKILFDFHNMNIGNKKAFKEYFNNYSNKYKKLAKILNKLEENKGQIKKKINILPQLLTYSLFNKKYNKEDKIEHTIDSKIKEYYKLK